MLVAAAVVGGTGLGLALSDGGHSDPAAADHHLVAVAAVSPGAHFLFRTTVLDHHYGLLEIAPAAAPNSVRAATSLHCARVAYAAGRGVCLTRQASGASSAEAIVFDDRFAPAGSVPLDGYPNRVQLSADGRYAGITDFVAGDAYDEAAFSTRTEIVDLRTDTKLFDLEQLHVTRNGVAFSATDFNFWGVTFARDDRHFYATLASGGATYLIEGDMATMQARVLRANVECPSLSPDGTRIAFKKRVPGATIRWRLSVLDVATLQDHPLAETRNVDDQAYWLNDSTVAYGLAGGAQATAAGGLSELTAGGSVPTDMWEVPADGSGAPRLLIGGAWSAVLVPGS